MVRCRVGAAPPTFDGSRRRRSTFVRRGDRPGRIPGGMRGTCQGAPSPGAAPWPPPVVSSPCSSPACCWLRPRPPAGPSRDRPSGSSATSPTSRRPAGRMVDQQTNPAFHAAMAAHTPGTFLGGVSDQLAHPDRPMLTLDQAVPGGQQRRPLPHRLGPAGTGRVDADRVHQPVRRPHHRAHVDPAHAVHRPGHGAGQLRSVPDGRDHDRVDPGVRGDVPVGRPGPGRGRVRGDDLRRPGPGPVRDLRPPPRRLAVV